MSDIDPFRGLSIRRAWSRSALFSLLFAAPLIGAGPREQVVIPQKHEVDVRLVLIDVIATKGGRFFPGLKKEDFQVFVDGNEIRVDSCDLIVLGTSGLRVSPGAEPKVPVVERKKRLVALFDGINAGDREFRKAAQQISDELVSLAKNAVDVMVLVLDAEKGLKIVQPFTDQESLIREAAKKAAGSAVPPLSEILDYSDLLVMANVANSESQIAGIAGIDMSPIYAMRAFDHANTGAARLTRTVGGLLATLVMLEGLPGRKNLLLVSAGLPDVDTFGLADRRLSLNDQIPFTGTISIFDPFGILGKRIFRSSGEVLAEVVRVANDRNISVYSLDPAVFSKNVQAGASAEFFDRVSTESQSSMLAERDRQLQNLRTISERTGATLLRGADKIESLREVVGGDLSAYYQLSFTPPKTSSPGDHKVEVRVKEPSGLKVRARDSYSDSTPEAAKRLVLARAFYDPVPFVGRLPFQAELISLHLDEAAPRQWLNVALPGREFFFDRYAGRGQRTFELHLWIKGEADRAQMGSISIPLDMEAARKRIGPLDFYRLHFAGPGLTASGRGGEVVFALFDPESGEVGTWISSLPPAAAPDGKTPSVVNCTFVQAAPGASSEKDSFSLDGRDGYLAFGPWRLFPKVAGPHSLGESAFIFVQVYDPAGSPLEIDLEIKDRDGAVRPVTGAKAAEHWGGKSRIWSGALKVDFGSLPAGEYLLKIEIPMPGIASPLVRMMPLALR